MLGLLMQITCLKKLLQVLSWRLSTLYASRSQYYPLKSFTNSGCTVRNMKTHLLVGRMTIVQVEKSTFMLISKSIHRTYYDGNELVGGLYRVADYGFVAYYKMDLHEAVL